MRINNRVYAFLFISLFVFAHGTVFGAQESGSAFASWFERRRGLRRRSNPVLPVTTADVAWAESRENMRPEMHQARVESCQCCAGVVCCICFGFVNLIFLLTHLP